ncbi:hypothetical protein CYMTET_7255 [Cymbomonas tetramitiformis]|uniref:Uncharacterized protein n=1 Tax=Cymbomonas tetramitiformis TaxID=36881 RepID=A0AAE0LH91_9CHLO|nr:hypothetical protein CYMTET_7255 [Cymbomonas tetramitiformis]
MATIFDNAAAIHAATPASPSVAAAPAASTAGATNAASPLDGKRVLLEFARRIIDTDAPFQGTAEMLAVRLLKGVDPHDAIANFNAALAAARRRSTLDDEKVKSHFIRALDVEYYFPVTSRLLLHDQRAAVDLSTIQQWGAADDLMELVLDLKRQMKALANNVNGKGFTPRVDKPLRQTSREVKHRVAAKPLNEGGNWSQSHTDKPIDDVGREFLAMEFQHAIDNDDDERFDALCFLAGGKPEMVFDLSACSFCVEAGECLASATVSEYTQYVQAPEAQMGFVTNPGFSCFSVSGASDADVHMGAFTGRVTAPLTAPPPPAEPVTGEGSDDDSGSNIFQPPPQPFMPQEFSQAFIDKLAGTRLLKSV